MIAFALLVVMAASLVHAAPLPGAPRLAPPFCLRGGELTPGPRQAAAQDSQRPSSSTRRPVRRSPRLRTRSCPSALSSSLPPLARSSRRRPNLARGYADENRSSQVLPAVHLRGRCVHAVSLPLVARRALADLAPRARSQTRRRRATPKTSSLRTVRRAHPFRSAGARRADLSSAPLSCSGRQGRHHQRRLQARLDGPRELLRLVLLHVEQRQGFDLGECVLPSLFVSGLSSFGRLTRSCRRQEGRQHDNDQPVRRHHQRSRHPVGRGLRRQRRDPREPRRRRRRRSGNGERPLAQEAAPRRWLRCVLELSLHVCRNSLTSSLCAQAVSAAPPSAALPSAARLSALRLSAVHPSTRPSRPRPSTSSTAARRPTTSTRPRRSRASAPARATLSPGRAASSATSAATGPALATSVRDVEAVTLKVRPLPLSSSPRSSTDPELTQESATTRPGQPRRARTSRQASTSASRASTSRSCTRTRARVRRSRSRRPLVAVTDGPLPHSLSSARSLHGPLAPRLGRSCDSHLAVAVVRSRRARQVGRADHRRRHRLAAADLALLGGGADAGAGVLDPDDPAYHLQLVVPSHLVL